MSAQFLFWPILAPLFACVIILLVSKREHIVKPAVFLLTAGIELVFAILLLNRTGKISFTWGGFGMDFALRIYPFTSWLLLALAVFFLLIAFYTVAFMRDKDHSKRFYASFLLAISLACGVILANNLAVLLFFWAALTIPFYGIVIAGGKDKYPTAMKTVVLNAIADFSLVLGIALTGHIAGTYAMDSIFQMPLNGVGTFAFVCLVLGICGKAGAMPFHSWLPEAALDAPTPFLPFWPGALQKLLSFYLMIRVATEFYQFTPQSGASIFMLVLGLVTLLLAAVLALQQQNYKRMLTYISISQTGFLVLSIGTALPIGFVAALFHLLNDMLSQCVLFFTAGALERQTGTCDLRKLGGLRRSLPLTFLCFCAGALSLVGVPPFAGFFAKALLLETCFEAGIIYYLLVLLAIFLIAICFLRAGHAIFFGESHNFNAKETPPAMWLPGILLSVGTLFCGIGNIFPLRGVIQPALNNVLSNGQDYAGLPQHWLLLIAFLLVLVLAISDHIYGCKKSGGGAPALEHLTQSPVLRQFYSAAEKRYFDPYEILLTVMHWFADAAQGVGKGLNYLYDASLGRLAQYLAQGFRKEERNVKAATVAWAIAGGIIIIIVCLAVYWIGF